MTIHDDIQLSLMDNEKRITLLKLFPKSEIEIGDITFEKRIKPTYEPEIFLDAFEMIVEIRGIDHIRVWEIKSELNALGETLRQLNKYRDVLDNYYSHNTNSDGCHAKVTQIILIYAFSRYDEEIIKNYFANGGIDVFHYSLDSDNKSRSK